MLFIRHRVTGARLQKAFSLIGDMAVVTSLFILAITLEPIRYLMAFFMMSSHNKPRHNKPPRVCDLLLDNISPVIAVLQYFSTLLRRGAPGRLHLILGREGDTSLAATTSHLLKIKKLPWTLAKLIDMEHKKAFDYRTKKMVTVPHSKVTTGGYPCQDVSMENPNQKHRESS